MIKEFVQFFIGVVYTKLLKTVLFTAKIFEAKDIEDTEEAAVLSKCRMFLALMGFRTCTTIDKINNPGKTAAVQSFSNSMSILLSLWQGMRTILEHIYYCHGYRNELTNNTNLHALLLTLHTIIKVNLIIIDMVCTCTNIWIRIVLLFINTSSGILII